METEIEKKGDGLVYWLGIGAIVVLIAYLAIGFLVK